MIGFFGQTRQKTAERERYADLPALRRGDSPHSSNALSMRREKGWEMDVPRSFPRVRVRKERIILVDKREYYED